MAVPTDLTGKTLWLRAKDLAGADGAAVTSWADQSGLGHSPLSTGSVTKETGETPSGGACARLAGSSVSLPPLYPSLGVQATVSSNFNPDYTAASLVDGLTDTGFGWASAGAPSVGTPQWARLQLPSATVVTQYRVYPLNTSRAPKDFTFQGSNDGSSWTTLDTRTAVAWASTASKLFTFTNSTAYTYYRLHVTATQDADLLHLYEIELNETKNGTLDSPAELWMVIRATSTNSLAWRFGTGAGGDYYPFSDGKVYSAGFTTARYAEFTPTLAINQWRLIRISQNAGVFKWLIDEAEQFSQSGTTAKWTNEPQLGVSSTFDIAEVLLLTEPADTAERADLITYFNTEHGLSVPGGSSVGVSTPTLVGVGEFLDPAVPASTVQAPTLTGAGDMLGPNISAAPIAAPVLSGLGDMLDPSILAGVEAEIPVGVTVEAGTLSIASTVALAGTEVRVGLGLVAGATRPIVPLAGVTIPLGLSLVGRAETLQPADPRTGGPQWRYVVTDRDGTPLGELPDIEHDPVDDGVNEPGTMQLRLATSDPARALIKPIERQCEVWEHDKLLLRGPILHGRTTEDGQTVTHQVHDPSWWWRGGRRVIGRIPMLNLLKNGDFTQGLTYWTRGFDADSIPAAKPTVTIVDEDFANDSDGLDPIKAAQIVGVESVTITETELQSSAVYWPNRPFAWEPLEDGFRPEGPAAIDAVANDMPATAGLKVTIVGHTANDGTGSGMDLSLRRAEAAKARVQAIRPGAVITTRGVGFYEPNPAYPIDSQQQRRVVISYESTTTITAQSKQWIRQTITVTQPKSARYPLELTAAAMLKVADDWSVEDANMTAIKVVARRQGSTVPWDERLGVGSTSISDTDPVERWLGEAASATIPADDRTYEVDVYLYAAAALTRYTAVGLFPAELLYFWGVDQALIVKGGVEHMQDPAMGHGPLGVTTRTPLTGIKRDRVYPHRDRMPMETFFDEWPSLAGGMDIDVLTTRTETILATFHPRQGQVIDYALVQGGNVVGATPATTDDVGSSIIAQAQDLGPFRREAYARDSAAFDGLLLERVITAEQETPLNELGEIARAELGLAKVTTPSYWLDIHPDRAGEVKARIAKGDTVRLVLDFPDQLDTLARVVHRKNHPSGYRLLVALEEA